MVKHVDRVVLVHPGHSLIDEIMIESLLRPLHVNMISLWHVTDADGRPAPSVQILDAKKSASVGIRVEMWPIPVAQAGREGAVKTPSYASTLDAAMQEAVSVARARTYVRFVATNVPAPTRVRVRVKIAVDKRRMRDSWRHVRDAVILRENSLGPGEFRIVPRV